MHLQCITLQILSFCLSKVSASVLAQFSFAQMLVGNVLLEMLLETFL